MSLSVALSGVVAVEFGHFDTKSFRCKSTRYKVKSFRVIIKVDSILAEKSIRFNSTFMFSTV